MTFWNPPPLRTPPPPRHTHPPRSTCQGGGILPVAISWFWAIFPPTQMVKVGLVEQSFSTSGERWARVVIRVGSLRQQPCSVFTPVLCPADQGKLGVIMGQRTEVILWQPASTITSPGFAHYWGLGIWEQQQKQERQNKSRPSHTSIESWQFSHLIVLKFGKLLFKPICPFQFFPHAIWVSNWEELGPFPLCPHILTISLLNHHPFSREGWRGLVMAASVVSFVFLICWKLQSCSDECDYISPSLLNPSYNTENRQGGWGRKM